VGRRGPRAAWVSSFAPRYRILGFARSRDLRFSKRRLVGIDCAFARHWPAWTQADVSQSKAIGLELLRSLHRHDRTNQRLCANEPLRTRELRLALQSTQYAQDRRSLARDSTSETEII